jgi:hypothetical protein
MPLASALMLNYGAPIVKLFRLLKFRKSRKYCEMLKNEPGNLTSLFVENKV